MVETILKVGDVVEFIPIMDDPNDRGIIVAIDGDKYEIESQRGYTCSLGMFDGYRGILGKLEGASPSFPKCADKLGELQTAIGKEILQRKKGTRKKNHEENNERGHRR